MERDEAAEELDSANSHRNMLIKEDGVVGERNTTEREIRQRDGDLAMIWCVL
jgi:hypothetical protein